MKVAVLREDPAQEPRVAATPETVKKLIAAGAAVAVESGAGAASGLADQKYRDAGAEIAGSASDALRDADLVLRVRRPENLEGYRRGAAVVALMDPYDSPDALRRMAEAGVSAFALELIPRITRAQSMDVLSSQANLAGYRAVIEAAEHFGRATADDDDGGRHRAGGAHLRHGRRRRRPAGDRHGAPPRRHRQRHRCPPRRQGAGRLARRQVHRGGGRGVQGGGDRGRLRQGNVAGIPGEAGGARRRAHRQAGHRHHDGADPRPPGAEARHRRHGRLHAGRLGDRRSGGGARRQCRGRGAPTRWSRSAA